MTKIWRKQEWERQLEENPDECIRISPDLVINKSNKQKDKNEQQQQQQRKKLTTKDY